MNKEQNGSCSCEILAKLEDLLFSLLYIPLVGHQFLTRTHIENEEFFIRVCFSCGKISLFSCYLKTEKVNKKIGSNGMLMLNGLNILKKRWDELLNLMIQAAFLWAI